MRLLLVSLIALSACRGAAERETVERARIALENGESVLDVRADGASLIARELPTRPQGDGPRQLGVRLVRGGTSVDLGILADARLVDGAVVAVGTDGVLTRIGDAGDKRELDRNAWAPLSIRGRSVAYVRGEPPTLELAIADIDRGAPTALAPDWVPAWCPAIADDGSVVFVTGRAGVAQIARVRPGDAPRVIVEQPDAFPEGPDAPTLAGNRLTFFFRGEQRTVVLP